MYADLTYDVTGPTYYREIEFAAKDEPSARLWHLGTEDNERDIVRVAESGGIWSVHSTLYGVRADGKAAVTMWNGEAENLEDALARAGLHLTAHA